jgi:hypothetical protein
MARCVNLQFLNLFLYAVDELNICPEPGAVVHLDGPQDSHYLKEYSVANSQQDFPVSIEKSQAIK